MYIVYNGQQYIEYSAQRSNLGNVYITIKLIRIDECQIIENEKWTLYSGKELVTPVEKLPNSVKEALLKNKDSLPLFDYVYW